MRGDTNEALRYLEADESAPDALCRQVEEMGSYLAEKLQPRFVYRVFQLSHEENGERLAESNILLTGNNARKMLAQCDQAILMACTLGAAFETLLRAEQARDMARAAILNACGSALVERGCDAAEEEIQRRFSDRYLTDRFSPGYGDLPLNLQPEICAALDVQRRLGIHVTESLLMIPSKSVTAVIGLSDRPQMARIRGCAYCTMKETCMLRKGGKRCGM